MSWVLIVVFVTFNGFAAGQGFVETTVVDFGSREACEAAGEDIRKSKALNKKIRFLRCYKRQ